MRSKKKLEGVLISGITLIVIGIVLVVSSGMSILGPAVNSKSTFSEIHPGEYSSPNITLTASSVLVVLNVTGNYHVIPQSDLKLAGKGNITLYSINPYPGNRISIGGSTFIGGDNSTLYGNLTGTYIIVTFSFAYPEIAYMVEHPGLTDLLGITGSIGLLLFFFGIPVLIIGITKEIHRRRRSKDLEDLMNL